MRKGPYLPLGRWGRRGLDLLGGFLGWVFGVLLAFGVCVRGFLEGRLAPAELGLLLAFAFGAVCFVFVLRLGDFFALVSGGVDCLGEVDFGLDLGLGVPEDGFFFSLFEESGLELFLLYELFVGHHVFVDVSA